MPYSPAMVTIRPTLEPQSAVVSLTTKGGKRYGITVKSSFHLQKICDFAGLRLIPMPINFASILSAKEMSFLIKPPPVEAILAAGFRELYPSDGNLVDYEDYLA